MASGFDQISSDIRERGGRFGAFWKILNGISAALWVVTDGFGQISVCMEVGLQRFERFKPFWTAFGVVASGFGQIAVCAELDSDNLGQRLEGIRRRFRVVWMRHRESVVSVGVSLERFGAFGLHLK